MKVMAINSSPRVGGESKTELFLDLMLQGMKEAGAEVESVNLKGKKINNCIGCFQCWTKTPGVCVHHDDMSRELLPQWSTADVAVYASPLYNYTVTATMKAFMERCLPALQPYIEFQGDRAVHPLRHNVPDVVVFSVAGFPGMEHFAPMSHMFRHMYSTAGRSLLAEIYIPSASALESPYLVKEMRKVSDALINAGRELVRDRKVSEQTMGLINEPVTDPRHMADMANLFWKSCIEQNVTPREFTEKGLSLRPDTLESFMTLLRAGFNPEKADQAKAVLEFDFSGRVEEACHAVIENGTITVNAGPAEGPDLKLITPFETWMDIMTGRADGAALFMAGKYTVEGNGDLLMKMGEFFGN